jgi:hypothetical protein
MWYQRNSCQYKTTTAARKTSATGKNAEGAPNVKRAQADRGGAIMLLQ